MGIEPRSAFCCCQALGVAAQGAFQEIQIGIGSGAISAPGAIETKVAIGLIAVIDVQLVAHVCCAEGELMFAVHPVDVVGDVNRSVVVDHSEQVRTATDIGAMIVRREAHIDA